jgi:UDP-glucose 4-epimerase
LAKYLVTGGAGFIGSNLVRYLLDRQDVVRVLDNFSTGKRQNLEEVADRIELVEGDLCDAGVTEQAVQGMDFVLHQAAIPSVPRSVEFPLESHAANATGTLILLEAARRAKVKRLVYASSSSVYGANETLPKQETMQTEPMSPYAVAKLAAEHYCLVYHRLYGLETVALRYFNVFGPRQDPSSPYSGVISQFIEAINSETSPVIYGDGEQTRDFTFVDNVAQANLAACASSKGAGRAYNIGCAKRFSINELWANMSRLAGLDREAEHKESRAGDVRHSLADVSRAKEFLDYVPRVDFIDGLEHTLRFYGVLSGQRGAQ